MLVVNQGVSGVYYVFRGSAAREFTSGLELIEAHKTIVLLPKGRKEAGIFFFTKCHTGALVLNPEDISDSVAKLAFRQTLRQLKQREKGAHGPTSH